jgi:protein-S-isoprenylcysteine O-methyltransferase Ste14
LVALLGGSAIGIFIAATRAMGKNWSVVARLRSDHQLVRTGPFRVVRHPIYVALFLYLLSFGVAFGHLWQFVISLPIYGAGTMIRIRVEEKLLRARFGEDHARYAREVSAFIPGLL